MSPHTPPLPHPPDAAHRKRTQWLELPARADSVTAARRSLEARLTAWRVPGDARADAALLLSELAANAVVHTSSSCILCGIGMIGDACLRIEVHDHDRRRRRLPRGGVPGVDAESGRGLFLVERLATAWGVGRSRLTGGNAVWATLITVPGVTA
ncbi:ATP-binding protein [Streptomyces sp. NPDC006134]|uniref:ATP-binding protein n=1 Tax=Streptomyces sp. NPDC006134 TaxID=3154467 RepID=UPI0033F1C9FA